MWTAAAAAAETVAAVVFIATTAAIYSLQHGYAPLLQCLGRLSLPPFVGRYNECQFIGWVIITMAMVDLDDSCQFSADSQPKSTGLV